MPKQSQKLKQIKHNRVSFGFLILKYLPYLLVLAGVTLILSIYVRLWMLEFIVSYIPQILIILSSLVLIYATAMVIYVLNYDFDKVKKDIGKASIASLVVGILSLSYVLIFTLNIVNPVKIVSAKDSSKTMKISTFNRLYKNKNFHSDALVIARQQVDIVSLEETTSEDLQYLKSISGLDYSFITDCDCSAYTTEVGLVSRYPIVNAITIYENENAVILRSLISSDKFGQFAVYSVHLHVPYVHDSYDLRDDMYHVLSNSINLEELPTFVLGDFNTSIFSPDMQRFVTDTPLVKNVLTRQWPECSWYGFTSLLCSRIDYIFTPQKSKISDFKILDTKYSDHRAVLIELSF